MLVGRNGLSDSLTDVSRKPFFVSKTNTEEKVNFDQCYLADPSSSCHVCLFCLSAAGVAIAPVFVYFLPEF